METQAGLGSEELIKFDDSVSTQALTDLQEHVKLLPAVITSGAEYKIVLGNYQKVRKLRIAVNKKGVALIGGVKKTFLDLKAEIENKEFRITKILTPIETDLKARREVWETKIETEKKEAAEKQAADAEAEFNRQEEIRIKFEIAESWDLAHGMNIDFDWKKVEAAEREADLKKRELEMELKEAWFDAHEEKDARELAEKMVEPTPEAKEELEKLGVTTLNFMGEKHELKTDEVVDDGPIMDKIGATIERIESSGDDELESAEVQLHYSLIVECPYCKEEYDLCDQDDDGQYSTPIFNNKWDDIKGFEITCPRPDCDMVATIKSVEY